MFHSANSSWELSKFISADILEDFKTRGNQFLFLFPFYEWYCTKIQMSSRGSLCCKLQWQNSNYPFSGHASQYNYVLTDRPSLSSIPESPFRVAWRTSSILSIYNTTGAPWSGFIIGMCSPNIISDESWAPFCHSPSNHGQPSASLALLHPLGLFHSSRYSILLHSSHVLPTGLKGS